MKWPHCTENLALAFGIAFLIAVALSVWLAHSITKPLSDIAVAAQQLAKGDHAVRIRTGSRDEVGLLADTLNHMTDQLRTKIDELSEDRAQLLAMLTSMVEGVMVLDCRGRVLQVNPALERMFDVTRMEARGHHCSEVFRHPKLDTLVSTVLAKRMSKKMKFSCTRVVAASMSRPRSLDAIERTKRARCWSFTT